MKRTSYIKVMVTKEEKVSFMKLAATLHTDISELVRQTLHRQIESKKAA